jgi:hypothetical protein
MNVVAKIDDFFPVFKVFDKLMGAVFDAGLVFKSLSTTITKRW